MPIGSAIRKYEYDSENARMLDHWWEIDSSNDIVTQSLRCYAVDEISNLCAEAHLSIVGISQEERMILKLGNMKSNHL